VYVFLIVGPKLGGNNLANKNVPNGTFLFFFTMQFKKHPILYSFLAILTVYCVNKIPLSNIFIHFGSTEKNSNTLEDTIFNSVIFYVIYFILKRQKIFFFFNSFTFNNITYYIPLVLYLFIFSGGLNSIEFLQVGLIDAFTLVLFSFDTLSSAFLEEILFRGLILGAIISKYYNDKDGILKSVIISSLMFGSIHILNLWTNPDTTFRGVFNQIYAVTCLGFMYSSVYLKTKNIFVLSVIHFISNFFAGVGELNFVQITETLPNVENSLGTIILTEFIRLIIFGIPLLIGLFVIKQIDKKDIEQFISVENYKQ